MARDHNEIVCYNRDRRAQALGSCRPNGESLKLHVSCGNGGVMVEDRELLFHLEEYKAMRSEIVARASRIDTITTYITIGNYFYFGWLITYALNGHNLGSGFLIIAAWIPLVITTLVWANVAWRRHGVSRIAEYVRKIEDAFALKGLGWEHFLVEYRAKHRVRPRSFASEIILFQVVLALAFGLYVTAQNAELRGIVVEMVGRTWR